LKLTSEKLKKKSDYLLLQHAAQSWINTVDKQRDKHGQCNKKLNTQ